MQSLAFNKIIEWNPAHPDQFAVASNSRLELYRSWRRKLDADGGTSGKTITLEAVKEIYTPPNAIQTIVCSSFNWHPSKAYIALGTSVGTVSVFKWSTQAEAYLHNPQAVSRRVCTGVMWNRHNQNHVAAGFEKSRNTSEFCAVVWDLEHSGMTSNKSDKDVQESIASVVFKPSSDEPISSICWLTDPNTLAVGTSLSYVRLYDVRIGGSSETLSISAHQANRPRKIKGIRPDPFNENLIATFSDSAMEPIKLWDLRKGSNQKPKLTILPHERDSDGAFSPNSAVVDVAWSTCRAHLLAAATTHSKSLSFYGTLKAPSEAVTRTPLFTIPLKEHAKSLSWQQTSMGEARATLQIEGNGVNDAIGAAGVSRLPGAVPAATQPSSGSPVGSPPKGSPKVSYPTSTLSSPPRVTGQTKIHEDSSVVTRMTPLLVSVSSGYYELQAVEAAALGAGADACVAAGSGNTVKLWQCRQEGSEVDRFDDIGFVMGARASAGYGMDAGKNLQVLSDELDVALATRESLTKSTTLGLTGIAGNNGSVSNGHVGAVGEGTDHTAPLAPSSSSSESTLTAFDRYCSNLMDLTRLWHWVHRVESLRSQNITLQNCGILNLLSQGAGGTFMTDEAVQPVLCVKIYHSKSRSKARMVCGWGEQIWGMDGLLSPTNQTRNDMSSPRQNPSRKKPYMRFASSAVSTASASSQQSPERSVCENGDQDEFVDNEENSEFADHVDFVLEELHEILEDCEDNDGFERAVCVALMHGNLSLAVDILQRTIDTLNASKNRPTGATSTNGKNGTHSPRGRMRSTKANGITPSIGDDDDAFDSKILAQKFSDAYLQVVSLVAMCLAGFHQATSEGPVSSKSFTSGVSGGPSPMWTSMCRYVLSQLEAESQRQKSSCYLEAACRFLLVCAEQNASADSTQQRSVSPPSMNPVTDASQASSTSTLSITVPTQTASTNAPTDRSAAGTSGPPAGSGPSVVNRWGKYSQIVDDERLSLEDRIAFVCTYMPDAHARQWLLMLREQSVRRGKLEGLAVTGLSRDGMDVLAEYVDQRSDIQTIALLVGRVIDPTSSSSSTSGTTTVPGSGQGRDVQWLNEYRNLLNRWQKFFERASLDVELGKFHRLKLNASRMNSKSPSGGASTGSRPSGGPGMTGRGRDGMGVEKKGSSERTLYALPTHQDFPHVYIRCHYCGSSLPVDPMLQQQVAFLRKQKPVIECCPNCKKQLPRCYVCSLYMGFVNPNAEFNRALAQRRLSSETALLGSQEHSGGPTVKVKKFSNPLMDPGDKVDHNALSRDRWFFFCQRCRHGGHASCIEEWFGYNSSQSRMSYFEDTKDPNSRSTDSPFNQPGLRGSSPGGPGVVLCGEATKSKGRSRSSRGQGQSKGRGIGHGAQMVAFRDVCGVSGCFCRCGAT